MKTGSPPPFNDGELSEEELEARAKQAVSAWKHMAATGSGPKTRKPDRPESKPGDAKSFSILKMILVCVGFPTVAMLLLAGALLVFGTGT